MRQIAIRIYPSRLAALLLCALILVSVDAGSALAAPLRQDIPEANISEVLVDHQRLLEDGAAAGAIQNGPPTGETTDPVSTQVETVIILLVPAPIEVGGTVTVTAQLSTRSGKPVADQRMMLDYGEDVTRQLKTDARGRATFNIKSRVTARERVVVTFDGTDQYAAATREAIVRIVPAVIEIETVPPLAGIELKLGDQHSISDAEGIARFQIEEEREYRIDLLTVHSETAEMKFEFDRWRAESYVPYRELRLPTKSPLQVGFSISYPVNFRFYDTDGVPVAHERIENFTLRSSHGALLTLDNTVSRWFEANRVTRRRYGIEEVPIQYALESVLIDGANVVNRGQQKYFAMRPNDDWGMELIFFAANFSAKDALFRFPVGSGIDLEYPNGVTEFHPFDENGVVKLHDLARGAYKVQAAGVAGMAPLTPVSISRFQEVDLPVVTRLDMGVFFVFGALFALLLLVIGRPMLLSLRIPIWPPLRPGRIAQTFLPAVITTMQTASAPPQQFTVRRSPRAYLALNDQIDAAYLGEETQPDMRASVHAIPYAGMPVTASAYSVKEEDFMTAATSNGSMNGHNGSMNGHNGSLNGHKRWPLRDRIALVKEILRGEYSVSEAAEAYGLSETEILEWRDQALDALDNAFGAKAPEGLLHKEHEIMRLKQKIGELIMELEAFRAPVQSTYTTVQLLPQLTHQNGR